MSKTGQIKEKTAGTGAMWYGEMEPANTFGKALIYCGEVIFLSGLIVMTKEFLSLQLYLEKQIRRRGQHL